MRQLPVTWANYDELGPVLAGEEALNSSTTTRIPRPAFSCSSAEQWFDLLPSSIRADKNGPKKVFARAGYLFLAPSTYIDTRQDEPNNPCSTYYQLEVIVISVPLPLSLSLTKVRSTSPRFPGCWV
eukprot:g2591.t1